MNSLNQDLSQLSKYAVVTIFCFIGLLMILIAGSRFFGGDVDYAAYEYMIRNVSYRENSKELSFQFLLWLNDVLFNSSVTVFMYIFAVLGVGIKFFALFKLSKIPLLSLILYVMSYFWLHEYVQIRAAVAIGIFILSIKDLSDGNLKKYMFKVALAIVFHWSSIILIMLYFIVRCSKNRLFVYLPFLGLLIYASNILPSLGFAEALDGQLGPEYEVTPFNLNSYMNLMLFISSYFAFSARTDTDNQLEITLVKIFSFSYFLYCLLCAIGVPVAAFRFSEYFNVISVLIFPALISHYRKRILFAILITLTALSYSLRYGYILIVNVETAPELARVIRAI